MLVTGASSFVGTHVSESLASLGHEVIRTFRRHNERILNLADYSPVEMNQLDFSCRAYLNQLASDFDAIVHNAGSSPSVDVDVNTLWCAMCSAH
jgi:nucleoside-diphosphate-sugar epimerase